MFELTQVDCLLFLDTQKVINSGKNNRASQILRKTEHAKFETDNFKIPPIFRICVLALRLKIIWQYVESQTQILLLNQSRYLKQRITDLPSALLKFALINQRLCVYQNSCFICKIQGLSNNKTLLQHANTILYFIYHNQQIKRRNNCNLQF